MAEFKKIETQEELDAVIKDRLARNTTKVTDEITKKYEGYLSPDDAKKNTKELTDKVAALTTQLAEKEKAISDLTAKNQGYETSALKARIAHEKGIPFELADRLNGTTEEEIGKDADMLSQLVSSSKGAPPLASNDKAPQGDPIAAAYASWNAQMKGE